MSRSAPATTHAVALRGGGTSGAIYAPDAIGALLATFPAHVRRMAMRGIKARGASPHFLDEVRRGENEARKAKTAETVHRDPHVEEY